MRITIIVPVFNVEKYLSECIESVLRQTYRDFELILVDDGSTDGSGAICDQYSNRYSEQINTIHEINGGSLRARLIGIQESKGDVLIFLDSDDCLRQDALEQIARCFDKNNCDMVLYNTESSVHFSTQSIKQSLEPRQVFEGESKKKLYEKIIDGGVSNSVCLKAIRSECARVPEWYMNHKLMYGEDLLLSASFITNCKKIVYLEEGLYYYRNRPGSAVRVFDVGRIDTFKFVNIEVEKYIKEWGLTEITPTFNARKVKGWIVALLILIDNKNNMDTREFNSQITKMAEDPYFRNAYENMALCHISKYHRIIAYFLYKKQYLLIRLFYSGVQAAKKVMSRRKDDR